MEYQYAIEPEPFIRDFENEHLARAKKKWYVLSVPPPVVQHLSTCWAASLASWLSARTHKPPRSVRSIIARYAGSQCLTHRNALQDNPAAFAVFGEWGVGFMMYSGAGLDKLKHHELAGFLRKWGHLLLVEQVSLGMNHVTVLYGVGINAHRRPAYNWFSIMDPLRGSHRYQNRYLGSLRYPIYLGFATGKGKRAKCLNRS